MGAAWAVTIPLARRKRWIWDDWNRSYSTVEYYGLLTAGSVAYRVAFDTGSGNVVLPCSGCQEAPISLTFGTGEVNGSYVSDVVCVAELCAEMRLIACRDMSQQPFHLAPFQGVLGLGLPALSEGADFSYLDHLAGVSSDVWTVFDAPRPFLGCELLKRCKPLVCEALESLDSSKVKQRKLEKNLFAIYFSPEAPGFQDLSRPSSFARTMRARSCTWARWTLATSCSGCPSPSRASGRWLSEASR